MTVSATQKTFPTPDGENFTVILLSKEQTAWKLASNDFITAPKEYRLNNGHKFLFDVSILELLEIFPDGSSFVFSPENFEKYAKGENYWTSGINLDNQNLYISFKLEPEKAINFLKDAQPLHKYKPFESHAAYIIPDDRVIFVAHRIGELYDGNWFPTLEDFEYYYYSFCY
jgi:hypothetical protein